MVRMHLTELKNGMVLDRDLCGLDGHTLLPAGAVLDDKKKSAIASAGIEYAHITEESAGLAALLFDESLEKAAKKRSQTAVKIAGDSGRPAARTAPGGEQNGKKATPASAFFSGRGKAGGGESAPVPPDLPLHLKRIADMFSAYKSDEIMRNLCRLAIKCAKEGIVSG